MGGGGHFTGSLLTIFIFHSEDQTLKLDPIPHIHLAVIELCYPPGNGSTSEDHSSNGDDPDMAAEIFKEIGITIICTQFDEPFPDKEYTNENHNNCDHVDDECNEIDMGIKRDHG